MLKSMKGKRGQGSVDNGGGESDWFLVCILFKIYQLYILLNLIFFLFFCI